MNDRQAYLGRINRVIDHIDGHLAETLDLSALAEVAHFSPWHFHRVFQAITGETVAERVRRRRLEVAASRLLATPPVSALHVALDVGFGSAEVFTRAFRAHFGVTPSAWRRGAFRQWAERQHTEMSKFHQGDRKSNQAAIEAFFQDSELWPQGAVAASQGERMKVEIRTLPEVRVAYLRHVGPYGSSGITRLWQDFAAWAGDAGLMNPRRRMYGVTQDNPGVTPPEKCRYDACIEIDSGFTPGGDVNVQTIQGGRYACAEFTGTSAEVHAGWMRFIAEWVPESRYQLDDRPPLEIYERDFKIDESTGAFSCLLCLSVRSA